MMNQVPQTKAANRLKKMASEVESCGSKLVMRLIVYDFKNLTTETPMTQMEKDL